MDNVDAIEVISMLTKRNRVLHAVGTAGCSKRELTDLLAVSRSTIDRSIRELEAVGLLTRSTAGYRRTLLGELLLSEYDTIEKRTQDLLAGRAVLADLPPDFDLETVVFEDAEIVRATPHAPHQPISALCSLLTDARWIQTIFPAVFPQAIEACGAATNEDALRADIVVTEQVATALVSSHRETLQQLLDTSRVALHTVETRPAYGLVIAEQESSAAAGLLILADSGAKALIVTEQPAAVSWIRERIDNLLNQSTPLSALATDSQNG